MTEVVIILKHKETGEKMSEQCEERFAADVANDYTKDGEWEVISTTQIPKPGGRIRL